MLKALLRIPNVMLQAERCLETFPPDDVLCDKVEALYLAALTAIEGTTKWLKKVSAGMSRSKSGPSPSR